MRIIVTGGAGFIGSHLCDRLIKEGNDVICIDDLSTGSVKNISHLINHPGFKFIKHDIICPIYLQADEIYNLACPASPVHYQSDPEKTIKTSVIGALNVLNMAKGAKILQASTSEVYGDPEVHPQTECYWGNVNPIGPRSCYDEGKRCAEALLMGKAKIVRIFNTYGPRMQPDDGRVVSNFITQALKGDDITIYGDGLQTRSFQYIDDLLEGMIRMMASDFNGPVNIGNPIEFTVLELAEKVIQLTGSKSKLRYCNLPVDDPTRRQPDIALARDKLGWCPCVNLDEGLRRTMGFFIPVT